MFPSPPVIGDSIVSTTRQPSAVTNFSTSPQTAAWTARSRTIPFFDAPRPASNCGLINAISRADPLTNASADGSTFLRDAKLTSTVTKSGASSNRRGESERISVPSSEVMSGRRRRASCNWPCPTSTAKTRFAPCSSRTCANPPVEAPTSRQTCPSGSKRKYQAQPQA